MRAEMSWAKMAPDLKQIYKQNFSESEIEGLLAFYQSPVGKSFVEKMPAISQESMMLGQTMAMNLTPQLQELTTELKAEIDEYRANNR